MDIDAKYIVCPKCKQITESPCECKFWDTVRQAKKEVAKWPQWKRDLVITAETARTGNFYPNRKKND